MKSWIRKCWASTRTTWSSASIPAGTASSERLKELGYELSDAEMDKAFLRFKDLADKKKNITNRDLEAVAEDLIHKVPEKWSPGIPAYLQRHRGHPHGHRAHRQRRPDPSGSFLRRRAGQCRLQCLRQGDRDQSQLLHYALNAVTGGKDAIGEVIAKIEYNDKIFIGKGISTDILEASALAYLNAINKAIYENSLYEDENEISGK